MWIALSVESRRRVVAALVSHDRLPNLELARGVNHRHLAAVLDTASTVEPRSLPTGYELPPGAGVAVAALVPGRTLHQYLARKPMTPAIAVGWVARLAEAVRALHARGAWHGGISPFSVIVEQEGSGAVPMLSQLLVPPLGPYCSPERLKGAGPSQSDDVWALFATLFAALTGQAPFSGASREALAEQMLAGKGQAAAALGVEGPLAAILDRGLAPNPAERVSELSELTQLLTAWERNPRALPVKRAPRATPKSTAALRAPSDVGDEEIVLDPSLLSEDEGTGKLAAKKEVVKKPPPPSAQAKADRPRTTSLGMPKVDRPRTTSLGMSKVDRPRTTSLGMPKVEGKVEGPSQPEPAKASPGKTPPRAPTRTSLGLPKVEPPVLTRTERVSDFAPVEAADLIDTMPPQPQEPERLPDTARPPAGDMPSPAAALLDAERSLAREMTKRAEVEPPPTTKRGEVQWDPSTNQLDVQHEADPISNTDTRSAWHLPPPDPELVSSADAQSLVALARELPQATPLPTPKLGAASKRLSFNPFERKRRVWPWVAAAATVSAAGMYLAVGAQEEPLPAAAVEAPTQAPAVTKKAPAPKVDPAQARDACIRSHFEEGALENAKDLAFVCEDGDFRETARGLFAVASGVSGDPTRSADQSPLGWYELPATAIIRKSCCASLPPVLPETEGWCEQLQTVIRRVAEDSAKAGDLAPAARSFDKAVGCLFGNKIHRPYLYGRLPTAKNRANFEQFLSRAAISQARR